MMIADGHAACGENAAKVFHLISNSNSFGRDHRVDSLEQGLVSSRILRQFPDHDASGLGMSKLGLLLYGCDAIVANLADDVFGLSRGVLCQQIAIGDVRATAVERETED